MPSWIKYATTIISLVVALCGGIYAMEDRYVSDKEAAESLQNFNIKINRDLSKIELQILNNQLESITTEYYKHKQLVKTYPEDEELSEELELIKENRQKIKLKIENKIKIDTIE